MTEINWDDMTSGDYVSLKEIGDSVTGVILAVRPGTDFNGGPCPVLDLQTQDGEKVLTCGQMNLKAQIVALKPRPGDTIRVTLSSTEKVEKGIKKIFTIDHRGFGEPVAPAPVTAPATAPITEEPPF